MTQDHTGTLIEVREALVEARGEIDRLTQQGIRDRIDNALKRLDALIAAVPEDAGYSIIELQDVVDRNTGPELGEIEESVLKSVLKTAALVAERLEG